jgi:hypothetical protein
MKLRMQVRLPKDRTIVPEEKCSFGRFRRRFCGIRFHGVISIGATMPIQLVETARRLRCLQIPGTPATAPTVTGGGIGVFRGDIHPSHAPKVERKYKTLFPIFFAGGVKGQILSAYRARVSNPQKVTDCRDALAARDCNFGTRPLTKSLTVKLIEMGIDPEAE